MKIGLIALSGIRVVDEELLRLGLTLPGFVERSKTIASLPSLGLLTLAALTPPEHEVCYLEVPDPGALDELPDDFDLVAISSYSAQIFEAYELADRYREAGVPVVMGGLHVSALPDEASRHCD
ncbi:MAG: cobalamin-dependent protein, partial [Gemmatimonadetes bacterium]|nr:cobalamin-dependent protein [Gemmatimonadota bacterium]